MPYRRIHYTENGFCAAVQLLRPGAGEPGAGAPDTGAPCTIDEALAAELRDCCRELTLRDDIRAVTITGCGATFAIGRRTPPAEISHAPIPRRLAWQDAMGVAQAVADLPMPVIAIINGAATAHGLELALAADLRLAADTAHFSAGALEAVGLPYDGGTQRLPRLLGPALARDLLLTGRVLSAPEARDAGLVNRIAPAAELDAMAADLTARIAAAAPIASRYAKEAVNAAAAGSLPLTQGLRLEADLSIILQSTADRAAGLRSFAAKRPPQFRGH